MSAPPPGRPASSSSTGYEDGFGRRTLIFDRADGCTFERLSLRPEFGIFETALRDRAARLSAWSHDRVALPRRVHREQAGGPLLVDTAVPQGERLIDLLDATAEARADQALSGVDIAIGYLLDVMPTLDALHRGAGIVHGAIAPGRLLLTRTGHVVLLDPLYSEVVERLGWSRARLWRGLGLAMPGGQSPAGLTAGLDVSQAVLTALMLLLGRPLRGREQPDDLEAACAEAVEVAEIVVGGAFAGAFGQFLGRALPLRTAEGFATAAEAARHLSDVTGTAVDTAACRAALIALAGSLAEVPARVEQPETAEAPVAERQSPPAADKPPPPAPTLDLRIEIPEAPPPVPAPQQVEVLARVEAPHAEEAPLETVPTLVDVPPQREASPPLEAPRQGEAPPLEALRHVSAAPEPEPAPVAMALAVETAVAPPPEAPAPAAEEPATVAEPPAPPAAPPAPSGRRKRGRRGSDTLRSATPPPKPPPPAAPAPAPVREPAGLAPPAPIMARPPAPPPPPQPVFPAAGYDGTHAAAPSLYSGMGDSWAPPQPAAPQTPAAPRPGVIEVKGAPLRVKEQPRARSAPRRTPPPDEPFRPLPHDRDDRDIERRGTRAPRRSFPWKIAAAILVIVAGAAAGQTYLSERIDAPLQAPAVAAAAPVAVAPATGSLVLSSTPDGARVLVDGKPAGETPLTLDGVAPGRRVVTIISSAGTVRRTVRVEAGQAATLDVQVFSGWLAVDAPIVLEVEQGGRVIGSTRQNRLLLPPGRHTVTLSNADLGYRAGHTVNIEPGEEHRLSVMPSTPVNLNASPWAEVWIDGRRIGETPIAGVSIPLGTREIVFRHPDFSDRRLTPTIKVGDPVALSVDFSRPQ